MEYNRELLQKLAETMTLPQIEIELNLNQTSSGYNAKMLLKKYRIKKTPIYKRKIVGREAEIIDMYFNKKLNMNDIAKKIGCDYHVIHRLISVEKRKLKNTTKAIESVDETSNDNTVEKHFLARFNGASFAKERIGFVPESPEHNQCKQYNDAYELCKERIARGSYCEKHAEQNYVGVKPVLVPRESRYGSYSVKQLVTKEVKNNDFADIGKVL
jgi:predicted DNA-binding protein YlxM (UPF0122 family)